MRLLFLVVAVCTLNFHSFAGESGISTTGTAYKQTIALNPIFIPFGTITAEYEHHLFSQATTLGISGWYEYKDIKARWIYLKAMYYTGGSSLKGLGLGLTAGVLRAYRDKEKPQQLAQDTTPILGALVQYNWLFGKRDNILTGIGLGGRASLKQATDNSPLTKFDGDLRLVFGILL